MKAPLGRDGINSGRNQFREDSQSAPMRVRTCGMKILHTPTAARCVACARPFAAALRLLQVTTVMNYHFFSPCYAIDESVVRLAVTSANREIRKMRTRLVWCF